MTTTAWWPVDRDCLPEPDDDDGSPTQSDIDAAVELAAQTMWALTGRQYVVGPVRYRPPVDCRAAWHWNGIPDLAGLRALPGCGCPNEGQAVTLPGPVHRVLSVKLADTELPDDAWRVEGNRLFRVGAAWPPQNLDRPLPEHGTWAVVYERGRPVPAGVGKLTAVLAREFIAACQGSGKCRIPRTLVSTTQRGVTHVFDPSKILAAGKTGIPEIDLFLSGVNPRGLAEPPRVV